MQPIHFSWSFPSREQLFEDVLLLFEKGLLLFHLFLQLLIVLEAVIKIRQQFDLRLGVLLQLGILLLYDLQLVHLVGVSQTQVEWSKLNINTISVVVHKVIELTQILRV